VNSYHLNAKEERYQAFSPPPCKYAYFITPQDFLRFRLSLLSFTKCTYLSISYSSAIKSWLFAETNGARDLCISDKFCELHCTLTTAKKTSMWLPYGLRAYRITCTLSAPLLIQFSSLPSPSLARPSCP